MESYKVFRKNEFEMEETVNYSIIIPHYDIPDLLIRCLHSIPVRPDVQVIVVDDCSPEADKYLDKYPELSRPYLEFYNRRTRIFPWLTSTGHA